MQTQTAQGRIAADPNGHAAPPTAAEAWLANDLGLGDADIEPNFFKVESKKQRVVIMDVKGFGNEGKAVELKMKDAAGNPVKKTAKCFAEVLLLDSDTMRSSVWQVLSRPALANLRRVLVHAGPAFAGNLEVDIWSEGRGLSKVFHVVAVKQAIEPADNAVEDAPEESVAVAG